MGVGRFGTKCYDGERPEFHPSIGGGWAWRLPHLPATFEEQLERRTRGVSAEVRLRGGHGGLLSKGISVHTVVGWKQARLLLAVSGFSVTQVV